MQHKTTGALYSRPERRGFTACSIIALGGDIREGAGSRIVFELKENRQYLHRPHPGKEAKKYQVEELREWFRQLEVIP